MNEDEHKLGRETGTALRCPRHFSRQLAFIEGAVLEIRCRSCSGNGVRVYHRWDVQTRDQLPDRVEGDRKVA